MTKAEVVLEVSKQTGLEKNVVMDIVESYVKVVKGSLMKGENVYLRGFGTFKLTLRKAKTARNITKNIAHEVPAHYKPTFKAAKPFVEEVKKSNKVK
jgi:DNA-binding protein HU-beta